jgi:small subunit ribosomal protein S20
MANHVSAEKRARQAEVATARNRSVRTAVRNALKKARTALELGDKTKAAATVKLASVALARAASKGIVNAKAASRTTSRIESQLAKLG